MPAMLTENDPRSAPREPSTEELARAWSKLSPLDLWKERQAFLADHGYSPGPVDGLPGRKTIAAIRAFQAAAGLGVDGKWGPQTQAAMQSVKIGATPIGTPNQTPVIAQPSQYEDFLGEVELDADFWASFIDMTAKTNEPDDEGRRLRKGVRKLSDLTRIVWHQTAFTWDTYRELKAARKYSGHSKINAHICIDTDGSLLLLHPFDAYLWTANAFNPSCLSFEIMGNFEGLLGAANWYKPEKFGQARPTRIQLIRARQLTMWLLRPSAGIISSDLPTMLAQWRHATEQRAWVGGETAPERGRSPIKWINPHRGATDDRDLDCGSECWYHIGEHTIATYPWVSEGPLAGKGRPTPLQWRARPVVPPQAFEVAA